MSALAAFAFSTAAAAAQSEPPDAAREALAKLARELKIGPGDFVLARSEFQAPKNPGRSATWYVAYRQNYRGLPVFGASVRFVVSGNQIVSTRANAYPAIDRSVEPKVTLAAALQAIAPAGTTPVRATGIAPRTDGSARLSTRRQILLPIEKQPARAASSGPAMALSRRRGHARHPRAGRHGFTDDVTARDGLHPPERSADAPMVVPIANMTAIRQDPWSPSPRPAPPAYNVSDSQRDPPFSRRAVGAEFVVSTWMPRRFLAHGDGQVPGTHDWNWTSSTPRPARWKPSFLMRTSCATGSCAARHSTWTPAPVPARPLATTVQVRAGPFLPASYFSTGDMYSAAAARRVSRPRAVLDIIYHEYTHGSWLPCMRVRRGLALVPEGSAMHEGWADYFSSRSRATGAGRRMRAGATSTRPTGAIPTIVSSITRQRHDLLGRAVGFARYCSRLRGLACDSRDEAQSGALRLPPAVMEEDDNPGYSTDPRVGKQQPADGTPNIDAICRAYYDLQASITRTAAATLDEGPLLTAPPSRGYTLLPAAATTLTVEGTAEAGSVGALRAYVTNTPSKRRRPPGHHGRDARRRRHIAVAGGRPRQHFDRGPRRRHVSRSSHGDDVPARPRSRRERSSRPRDQAQMPQARASISARPCRGHRSRYPDSRSSRRHSPTACSTRGTRMHAGNRLAPSVA